MAKQSVAFIALNRGIVSRLGLARQDVKRIAMSAETMTNWKPRVLGSMMIRPGLGYLWGVQGNNPTRYLPFVYATDDTALLEFTDLVLRIGINDVLLTRPTVSTAVTNGTFAGNIAGWTDSSDGGATAPAYALKGSTNTLQLASNGTARSCASQAVTVAAAYVGIEHALRITIYNGPLQLRIGTAVNDDSYVNLTTLETGVHSISFTPTGTFYIQFSSTLIRTTNVTSCTVEAAGIVTIPTTYDTDDLDYIRGGTDSQSADVLYLGCNDQQQRKIERRGTHPNARSWSYVLYRPETGPFLVENVGPTTMTPAALNGNTTLTASLPTFRTTHVGALFQVVSTGQTVTKNMAALNDATTSIRVTGVTTDRAFTINISNLTAIGGGRTVILQRSFDNSTWAAVSGKSWIADTVEAYTDGLDNQEVWYRLLLSVVGGAGTTVSILSIPTGSVTGICRVTAFTSSTVVSVEVLSDFGGTTATDTWSEGQWSDRRGWPSAPGFYEGRLTWAGKNAVILSESDAFEGFSDETEGDSASINRTIGSGAVDLINWILPLQRMILGAQGAEHAVRSSSLDEPLTPTNFNIKPASTQGSAPVQAVKIDKGGIYVQRGGTRVFELAFDVQFYEYGSDHLSAIVPEIGRPGIVRMAAQRQIDTVAHFVRSDGIVACLMFDKAEKVNCWYLIESDGASGVIEDVVTLPGDSDAEEDQVYYVVKRTIDGSVIRNLEKWALESECLGDDVCKLADSHIVYQGSAVTNVAVGFASHLEGEEVVVWADGVDVGTETDSNGVRTQRYSIVNGQLDADLDEFAENIVIGLYYEGPWKSAKLLELQTELGTALTKMKTVSGLGLVMADVHAKGLRYGNSFDDMQDLPEIEDGAPVDADEVRVAYDKDIIEFPGDWGPDERLCLLASAPRPVTVLAAIADAQANA